MHLFEGEKRAVHASTGASQPDEKVRGKGFEPSDP